MVRVLSGIRILRGRADELANEVGHLIRNEPDESPLPVGEDHLCGGNNLDTKRVAGGDILHKATPHSVDLADKLEEERPALGRLAGAHLSYHPHHRHRCRHSRHSIPVTTGVWGVDGGVVTYISMAS